MTWKVGLTVVSHIFACNYHQLLLHWNCAVPCIPSNFDLFEVACGDDGDVYLMPNDILPHEDEMKAEILDGNDDNNIKGRKSWSSMPAAAGGGIKKSRMKQRRSSYTAEKPYGM